MSNNPFASALTDNFSNSRHDTPPPSRGYSRKDPPARPPKPDAVSPPSYEEVAGREKLRSEYPREKSSSSSSHLSGRRHMSPPVAAPHSSRPHRSHSDAPKSSSRHHHRDRDHEKSHRDRDRDRDRDRHHKSSRNKSPKKTEIVKAKNLDTIDKLDVTGFFGGNFHHDGPFDACTPHRNKNSKKAPVMAFPVDGPNNSIKGMHGNVDKDQQMNLAFGNYEENAGRPDAVPVIKTNRTEDDPQSTMYTPKQNPSVTNFDSTGKLQPVHGSVTEGLGSSTFVDGAPAPRTGHDDYLSVSGGGLGRKKSLVQRLRKNSSSESNTRRNSHDTSVAGNGDGRRPSLGGFDSDENSGSSLIRRVKSLKVGRR